MYFDEWDKAIERFIILARKHNVKMLMVGGAAVNFHGYQRHSASRSCHKKKNNPL